AGGLAAPAGSALPARGAVPAPARGRRGTAAIVGASAGCTRAGLGVPGHPVPDTHRTAGGAARGPGRARTRQRYARAVRNRHRRNAMSSTADPTVTIYHNPACGTSRNTLAMIRERGIEPQVIEYLKTPPSRERLVALIGQIGKPVREVMRRKGTAYDELQLDDPKWSDEQLVDLMLEQPILIERPIVVTPLGTRLCRPAETVLEILPER